MPRNSLRSFEPSYFAMVPKVYEIMEQKILQKFHEKGAIAEFAFHTMLKISGFLRKNFGCKIGRKLFQPILSEVFGKNIYGIGTGASPCSPKTTEFFLNMGIEWSNLYASTETSVPITATGIHDRYPVGTVGNVNRHEGISVKIHNPDQNGVGEIYVKSVLMMKGYFRDPIATQQAFDGDYFKTGDSGYIDKQGYLYVTGRIKEAILLPTGKKVSPVDLDQLYRPLCPEGCMLASCGIPVTGTGYDEIHVFIEAPSLAEEEKEQLVAKIMTLSGTGSAIYSVKAVHFISKIPLTAVGKVKRYQLKDLIHGEQDIEIQNEILPEAKTAREIIKENIYKINQRSVEDLTNESRLKEDLGLDSLSMFELSVAIETALNVQIVEHLGDINTFGELVSLASGKNKTNTYSKHYNIQDYPAKKSRTSKGILYLLMWLSRHLWQFEISGEENIPSDGNFILAPNHESHLDGLWIWTAIRIGIKNKTILNAVDFGKICCLAKEEHLEHGFSKIFMNLVGGIPVDRIGNTAPALRRCEDCLRNGYYALIHPEGTRTRDGKIQQFKKGAAEMALRTGTTLIPVTISGAREIYKPENKLPKVFDKENRSRYKLTISFGEAISPAEQDIFEMTTRLEERVRGGDNSFTEEEFPKKRTGIDYAFLSFWEFVSQKLYKIELIGKENIPSEKNYILCSNHMSYFDGLWIFTAIGVKNSEIDRFAYLAAKHTNEGFLNRRFFRMIGGIPVDRFGNTAPAIRAAKDWLLKGQNLVIHPEGARSRDGSMLPFKEGACRLAIDTNTCILPVRIEGAFEIFPRHRKAPRLFDWKHRKRYSISIRIGKPLSPVGTTATDLTEKLKTTIERL